MGWVTINGTHVLIINGKLQGTVGAKISGRHRKAGSILDVISTSSHSSFNGGLSSTVSPDAKTLKMRARLEKMKAGNAALRTEIHKRRVHLTSLMNQNLKIKGDIAKLKWGV